jgi:hypothetical protein
MMLYCAGWTFYLNLFELYTSIVGHDNLASEGAFWICIGIVLLMVLTTSVCSLIQDGVKPLVSMDYPGQSNCEHVKIVNEYHATHASP